jgi:hypothetical protein
MVSYVCDGDLDIFSMLCAHLHSQNGSMLNNPMFVECSVNISCINWMFQCMGGDLVFINEGFVTVDAFGSTV